jgi:hypothetical protein
MVVISTYELRSVLEKLASRDGASPTAFSSHIYCCRSITVFCFFDHEISIKIDLVNVRLVECFEVSCRPTKVN